MLISLVPLNSSSWRALGVYFAADDVVDVVGTFIDGTTMA